MNFTLVWNNTLTAVAPWGDLNSCTSFNLFTQLVAGDLLNFCSDISSGTIRNVVAYVWFTPLNKKIVNTVVNTGTSLELLSDTDIINKQNGQILSYDSTQNKWVNGNLNVTGKQVEALRFWSTSATS